MCTWAASSGVLVGLETAAGGRRRARWPGPGDAAAGPVAGGGGCTGILPRWSKERELFRRQAETGKPTKILDRSSRKLQKYFRTCACWSSRS
jgi:hypothetical protein